MTKHRRLMTLYLISVVCAIGLGLSDSAFFHEFRSPLTTWIDYSMGILFLIEVILGIWQFVIFMETPSESDSGMFHVLGIAVAVWVGAMVYHIAGLHQYHEWWKILLGGIVVWLAPRRLLVGRRSGNTSVVQPTS